MEFNILYRWHPTLSVSNEKWIEGAFNNIFGGRPLDQISVREFGAAMRQVQAAENKDPSQWNFGGCVIRFPVTVVD